MMRGFTGNTRGEGSTSAPSWKDSKKKKKASGFILRRRNVESKK